MRTHQALAETQSEEVGVGGRDSESHQAKLSRMKPKKKAVKLSAAAVDVLAGIPSTLGGSKATARDKQKREVVAVAILEKRKALVASQFTSATLGASNLAETTSQAHRNSSGAPSKDPETQVGGGASGVEPGTKLHRSNLNLNNCRALHTLIDAYRRY